METIIVEIMLAGVHQSYDFVLPAHVPVGCILWRLIEIIRQAAHVGIDDDHPCLYDAEGKHIIPLEQTLAQAGIRDSSLLVLI